MTVPETEPMTEPTPECEAEPQAEEQQPDLVRVRATATGFYDNLLRNPGEVSITNTSAMEPVRSGEALKELDPASRDAARKRIDTYKKIQTPKGTFLLPTWVV